MYRVLCKQYCIGVCYLNKHDLCIYVSCVFAVRVGIFILLFYDYIIIHCVNQANKDFPWGRPVVLDRSSYISADTTDSVQPFLCSACIDL